MKGAMMLSASPGRVTLAQGKFRHPSMTSAFVQKAVTAGGEGGGNDGGGVRRRSIADVRTAEFYPMRGRGFG